MDPQLLPAALSQMQAALNSVLPGGAGVVPNPEPPSVQAATSSSAPSSEPRPAENEGEVSIPVDGSTPFAVLSERTSATPEEVTSDPGQEKGEGGNRLCGLISVLAHPFVFACCFVLSFFPFRHTESEDEFFDAEEDHGHGHAAGARPSLISFSASEVLVHPRVETTEPADGFLELPVNPIEPESWHSLVPEVYF